MVRIAFYGVVWGMRRHVRALIALVAVLWRMKDMAGNMTEGSLAGIECRDGSIGSHKRVA